MAITVYSKYLETEVLSADPVKLVCMLYRAAIEAIGAARAHLKAGQIRERSRQITRAFEILHELMRSLDQSHAEISGPLGELYSYMQIRLLEANSKQIDAPMAEVGRLLTTLLEGWVSVGPVAHSPAQIPADYQPLSCTY